MKAFWKGLLFGGSVFGALTLLKNPNTGETNREKLKDWAKETEMATRTLTQNLKGLQNSLQELTNQGNESLLEVQKSLASLTADFIDSSEPQMLRLKNSLDRLKADLQTTEEKMAKMKEDNQEKADDDKELSDK
ncbi:MAG: YtxH domain-containing protein [Aerococcus sp.]|nr:YtxH domain-containing protein [Aerococcus sp.]